MDYITFHFCAIFRTPTPHPTHTPLCGLQWSRDPGHGVRLSWQRELGHPSPNAIQIKECIQREATLRHWPFNDSSSHRAGTIFNRASLNIQSSGRVKFGFIFSITPLKSKRCNVRDFRHNLYHSSVLCSCCSLLWLTFCFLFNFLSV